MKITRDWFAGFVDGEGCFEIANHAGAPMPRFRLCLRDDDAEVIRAVHKFLGTGRVYRKRWRGGERYATPRWRPQIGVYVSGHACIRVVELLAPNRLRSKKRRDFSIWAKAVRLFATERMSKWIPSAKRLARNRRLLVMKKQIEDIRAYR